jgi:hypothetical protein
VAAKSAALHEDARRKREEAERELITHRQLVAGLQTAYAKAARGAAFPGVAPRTSVLPMGIGRPEDMTPEERQLIGGLALLAGLGRSESAPAKPDPAEALKDQSRWRALGPDVLIPPRMP